MTRLFLALALVAPAALAHDHDSDSGNAWVLVLSEDNNSMHGSMTDLRVARSFRLHAVNLRVMGDVFNVTNGNAVLIRNNNVLSTAFNTIGQNLSPRIFRVGLVVGF